MATSSRRRAVPFLLLSCLLLLSTHIQQVTAGVMGIDLGSEFMKVSLVKPGSMMDIVTNIHSKRKTETMVSFYQVCMCVCVCVWVCVCM
jgi:hypoxia up-regulated 1